MEKILLKPNKLSFFFTRISGLLLLYFMVIFGVGFLFLFDNNEINVYKNIIVTIGASILLGILILYYIWLVFAYKKEEYIFTDNKIIYNYGNIFSDNSVELSINKITAVTLTLSFIENLLFKTGGFKIKTAGSSTSKTVLTNLKNTDELYETIQQIMKQNGFHLTKDKLVQEAKPHPLGIVFQIIGQLGITALVFVNFFIGSFSEVSEFVEKVKDNKILLIFLLIIALLIIGYLIVSYLDLRRRRYDVYTDSIFYTEGFLTKHYSFLPMEKISDVENSQGFFSKIFGLYDIVVSSEGKNNNVVFSNMTEGESMIKNIKYLKDSITLTKNKVINKNREVDELVGYVDNTDDAIDYDREFSAKYSMNLPRVIFDSLVIGIFLSAFALIISGEIGSTLAFSILSISIVFSFLMGIFKTKFTSYIVDKNTIEYNYEFLTRNYKTFTIDKITGISFSENIIDKLFKTCSVRFSSIGSGGFLTFSYVKKDSSFYENILSKCGIHKTENFEQVSVKFNFRNYILKNVLTLIIIFSIIIGPLIFIYFFNGQIINHFLSGNLDSTIKNYFSYILVGNLVLIFIVLLLKFLYDKLYYSKRFYSHRIYESFYESENGIIFQNKNYSLLKNIKGITGTKYPLTEDGTIVLDIAGDIVLEGKDKQSISLGGMKILGNYLENIYALQNKVDAIMFGREISEEIEYKSKQSIWNSIVGDIILTLIFLVLFIITPSNEIGSKVIFATITGIIIFSLIITIWYIKEKYYLLEKNRILLGSGIFYKSKKTILYDRLNFVEKNQGFFGKLFGNGKVKIYTVGSGDVDMIFSDTEDFKTLYEKINIK